MMESIRQFQIRRFTMSLPEIIRAETRQKLVGIAQSMLDGKLGIIEGSRRLAGLWRGAGIEPLDPDIVPFIGIDSETDHLPVGDIRGRWNAEALARKDREIAASEAHYRDYALSACSRLVTRFSDAGPSPEDYDHYPPSG